MNGTTQSQPRTQPEIHAFRALARHWVELRLAGDVAGARRALAAFVARLGRAFGGMERQVFFGAVEHCVAEHAARLEQRQARLAALTRELAAANEALDERPTLIDARRPERLSLSA